MRKYFSLMILFVMCAFVGLTGCGDIYENVSINTSTNEITLYVDGGTDENSSKPASQTITASIEGIQDASITSEMFVRFDNPAIATAGEFSYNENTGTVTITAQQDGTTDMYIVSGDNSLKVESEPIKVTVIEEVESIRVDETVKGSVALGQSINLNNLDNISFSPVTTSQTELEFYFYQEQNGVVSGATTADGGNLVITQNENGEYFLYALNQASVGTVRILVKSAHTNGFADNQLVKYFDIMVYDGFDESGIKVFDITSGTEQASELSSLTLLENYRGTNIIYNQKRLSLSVQNFAGDVISENLKYSLVPKTNKDKGYVDVASVNQNENFFDVKAQTDGTATYEIQISVVDDNGTEYLVVTKDFVFTVSRIVDVISVSNNNTTRDYSIYQSNTPLEVNVFQAGSYSGGLYGTEIISKVNTSRVSNDRFKLALTEVTVLNEQNNQSITYNSSSAEIADYMQYIQFKTENDNVLNFGDIIANETPIYVALNGTPEGERITSFVFSFIANYDAGMPSFSAGVRCLVCESVEEIIAPEDVLMKNGTTTTTAFTAGVGVAYNSRFDYSQTNSSVAEINMLSQSLTFEINALSAGTTTLTVTEKDTRISASIVITVVEVGEYAWLSIDKSDESSIRQTIMQDIPVYDDTSEENNDIYSIKEVVVTCGTSFGVLLNVSPNNATIVSSTVTPEALESSNITSTTLYGSLLTVNTNSIETSTSISVSISYYVEENGNLSLHTENLIFTVTTFVPYTAFNWGAGQTTILASVYDRDSLSIANQNQEDVGYIVLKPFLSSSSSRQYNLTYGFTTDTTGVTIEMVDANNTLAGVKIFANLGGATDSVRLEVYFEEYGKLASIYCDISILQPKQVENIQLRGDEELYLEAGATETSSYYQTTIQAQTSPVDALDSSLTYVLQLGDEVISSAYINSNRLFASYFGEYTSETAPLLFKYENGNIIAYINSNLEVDDFASEYVVRIVPSSMLNLAPTDENYLTLFKNITVFADQKIIVGTGTELNPFRISTEQDLIAISTKGLDRHYVLMNDIELTSAWKTPSGAFSGSLSSYQYTAETSNFIISGFYLDETITTANISHRIGFFAEVSVEAKITNVDFEFLSSTILINTSDSNVVNLTTYIGLLAGVNYSSNISNVSFFPQDNASLSVQIAQNAQRTVGVGGLVGINESGAIISDVSGEMNLSVQNLSSNVSLYVGGALGENRATFSGESVSSKNLWTSSISINTNTSPATSGVGGLVGRNNQQVSNISNFEVMTTIDANNINYVGGITGLNSGVINETFVSPKITANNYVGGAVGSNSANASISNIYVEFFYDQDNTNHTSITANEYVGGFVGQNNGQITTSYVHSYVPLTLVMQTQTLDSTTFYGDISAYNYVGGFVGYSESAQIQSCFANLQIGVLGSISDTNKVVGGFVGRLSNYNANQVIQFSYAITKILVNANYVANVGVFAGQLDITATAIYNSYAVCDDGNGYKYLQTEQLLTNGNNFVGNSNRASATSRCYYADSTVTETSGATNNIDSFGAYKRTLTEMQNIGQDDNTYTDWLEGYVWVGLSISSGYNNYLPILFKSYSSDASYEILFNEALSYVRVHHNSYSYEAGNVLPQFWTYYAETVSADVYSYDTTLQMVVVLQELDRGFLYLTDLVEVFTDASNASNLRLNISSSDSSIIAVNQGSLGYDSVRLQFLKEGTVKLTITPLSDTSKAITMQICVITGFSNYELTDENGSELNEDSTLLVVLGAETQIMPEIESSYDFSNQFGITYNIESLYNDEGSVIAVFRQGSDDISWNNNEVSINISANEGHYLYGNAKQTNSITITATLFANLQFYDINDNLVTHKFYFDGNATSEFPSVIFQNTFDIRVLRGITNAVLSINDAELENKESLPVKLSLETDNVEEVADNLNAFVKIYKDGQQISDVNTILTHISGTNDFLAVFDYEKVQLTENVIENWQFVISNESGEIVKTLNLKITWKPTSVEDVKAYHYIERLEYNLNMGDSEATTEIGSGRTGVLKVVVSPDYADYDYIVVSSSEAGQDKISFTHLYQNGDSLVSSNQYSYYLEDGSIVIPKTSSVNGIYHLSTLIAAGLTEGTIFTVTIQAFKNGETEPVATGYRTLTSVFAPYVNMTLDSDFSGNLMGRGTEANISVEGVCENSTVTFNITGLTNYGDVLSQVYLVSADGTPMSSYTNLSGVVSFDLSLYVGILASAKDGYFTLTATVESLRGSSVITTTSSIDIYIVDYLISSIYVESAENNVLEAIIQNGYTNLKLGYTTTLGTSIEAIDRFKKYTGETNNEEFYNAYVAITTDITADIASINGLTRESIWYHENRQLTTDSTFSEFYVATLDDCLGVRGRRDITLNFSAMLARAYTLDARGYLVCNLDVDFFDFGEYIEGSEYEYILNFQIAFRNDSTVEEPEQITSQEELEGMEANGHYILMNDITLTNWVPLTTRIGSLDGNGHVIYLESFSLSTINENSGKVSSINVGLFESISTYTDSLTRTTESTRLTNIIIDVSRATWIDLTGIATVNFGFLVGVNEGGIIYNCEIINTVTNQGYGENPDTDSWLAYYNSDANKIPLENNYAYANEVFNELKSISEKDQNASIVSSFIFVSPTVTTSGETSTVEANIGGLVGSNSGYITNSRVGRVSDSVGATTNNVTTSTKYGINLFGGGRLGGLVGYNTGTIASSYFANGNIVHMSSSITTNTFVGGLVAYNSGTITTSYVEGVKLENYQDAEFDTIRTTSGAIYSSCNVGGFVHSNHGTVENCYTNITINGALGVGGFVYNNATETSAVRYSYSASIINSSSGINGPFTGVDRQLYTLNSGIIENCYYLIDGYVGESEQEEANPISQTDIMSEQGEFLNGFVFGEGGVWTIDANDNIGPKLVEANNIALSNRIVMSEGTVVGEGLTYQSEQPGLASNPALIYNVNTFNSVFNNTASSNSKYVRFISNINFGGSSPENSTALTFQGELQGNGMVIEEVAILSELARTVYLGLFRDLDGAVVSNLSIAVNEIQGTQSYAVGGLAGQIKDSSVNNIKILSASTNSLISGYNITGGLTGIAVGEETKIANIRSQISIYSTFDVTSGQNEQYFSYSDDTRQNNISYAGGVIGVISLQNEFATNRANPPVINCETSTDIIINAEIAGGVFGLIDYNSVASYAKFILANNTSTTQKIEAGVIAGGVVGENRGIISNSYIAMESEEQKASDTAFSLSGSVASQTQLTTLFAGTPKVIAGLVGLNVGTNGNNVENQTGGIEYSYSRVDVINSSAQVAGGVIGVAVCSLEELNDGISSLIPSASNNYNSEKTIYTTTTQGNNFGTSFANFSAYINSIYNTGQVSATTVAGGFVGLTTAPMNAQYSNTALTIIPASVQATEQYNTFTGRIAGQILYENRTPTQTSTSNILFVDGTNMAISNAVVTANSTTSLVGGLDDTDVYNCLATNSRDLTLSQIVVSIANMNNVFNNFEQDHSSANWLLDNSLSNYIFPRLAEGQTITMQEISTVEEFFYYIKGGQGGNYRIVNDLTFDLSVTSVRQDFESLSNATQAVTGLIQGYGADGAAVTLTIIYDGTAMSIFNIITNLELSNINFVFEGDVTVENYENFGLIAREAYNSTISRTSITTNGTITPNKIRNLGGYFGVTSGCSYSNVSANVNYSNTGYTNHTSGEFLTGMIAGIAQMRNIIDYSELTPNIDMTFGSGTVYVGGMFGRVEGNITISSYSSSNIKISGLINLTGGNQNVGGVIGEIDGTSLNCIINKIDVSTEITSSSNQNINVGGAIGKANQIALSDITTSGNISISGSAQIYAGGIAGIYDNGIEFSETAITPASTFTNCVSGVDIDITNTSTQTSTVYVGGLMGLLRNNITSINQSSKLVQTNIYLNNYASGQITATAQAENLNNTVIYAGGLFGQVYNVNTQNSSEDISTLPAIASSASSVMIFATDFGQNYLGGIAGYSSMNITNVINYGSISFKSNSKDSFTQNNNLYLGGIVGYSKNNLSTALSLGMISSGGIVQNSVQPMVGYLDGGIITSCYYVSDLTGIFQDANLTTDRQGNKNITNLTLQNVLSPSQDIIEINVNWTFANNAVLETLSSSNYYILPYINSLQNLIVMTNETINTGEYVIEPNLETQMWIQKVNSLSDMQRAFIDTSYAYKSIIFETNITGANELNIGNVLRILGNSKTVTTSYSVFNVIPEDVLISGFVVQSNSEIDIRQISANTSITYGMLAPVNNGIISNCAVGGLPNYSSNTSNISILSENLDAKTLGENDDVLTINLNATTNSSTQIYIGGLVGQNNNIISNVWSYFDLNINITGQNVKACYISNLVGYNMGKMNYAYAMGKQTTTSAVWNNGVERNTYIAGVLAYSTQTVSDLVGMVDFSVYEQSPYNVNGSLGQGVNHSSLTGIIHANDISRTNSKVEAYVGAVSSERTIAAMQTTDISELGLNAYMWTRSESLNYGLPILNLILSARKNANIQDMRYTGSGTQSSPFEISHYIMLNKFATNSTGSYFALTRDLTATASVGTGGATTNKVSGNGFVIFVPDFAQLNYGNRTYTTFNVRLESGGVIESILLRVDGTLTLNGSNISVAPLAYTINGGTVQNCAVFGTVDIEKDTEARTASGAIGGLVANLTTGTVTKSWTDVSLTVTSGTYNVGGLVGSMGTNGSDSALTQSFASGDITIKDNTSSSIGGLVGYVSGYKTVTSGGMELYTSSASIDSCYYSGYTKHEKIDSDNKRSAVTIDNGNNYYGAVIGTVNTSSSERLNINNLRLTNIYTANEWPFYGNNGSANYANTTNILVGRAAGITEDSGIIFTSVYIMAISNDAWTVKLAKPMTPSGMNTMGFSAKEVGDAFTYLSGIKPVLTDVTPQDRWVDNYTE